MVLEVVLVILEVILEVLEVVPKKKNTLLKATPYSPY